MTITPTIYDWPSLIVPINQLFYAGGEASEGLYTASGVQQISPEPGGRAFLDMSFNYMRNDTAGRVASWLISKVANGNVFRIPIWKSLQVATGDANSPYDSFGIPWDNDQPWDNNQNWAYEPLTITTASALAGTTTIVMDLGDLGAVLDYGHVIGPSIGGAYLVDEIEYDGTIATIKVTPPLRRAVAQGDLWTLRPAMYGTMDNPESFRSMFEKGLWVRPGNATMIEAII